MTNSSHRAFEKPPRSSLGTRRSRAEQQDQPDDPDEEERSSSRKARGSGSRTQAQSWSPWSGQVVRRSPVERGDAIASLSSRRLLNTHAAGGRPPIEPPAPHDHGGEDPRGEPVDGEAVGDDTVMTSAMNAATSAVLPQSALFCRMRLRWSSGSTSTFTSVNTPTAIRNPLTSSVMSSSTLAATIRPIAFARAARGC